MVLTGKSCFDSTRALDKDSADEPRRDRRMTNVVDDDGLVCKDVVELCRHFAGESDVVVSKERGCRASPFAFYADGQPFQVYTRSALRRRFARIICCERSNHPLL